MPPTLQPELHIVKHLSIADWVVFVLIFLVTLSMVVFGNLRRRRLPAQDAEADLLDLLLMGRRLTLPLFTATLVATWYGGIFGVTENAFDKGIFNWLTQGVFWYVAYLIFACFLVARIRNTRARTMPDLLGKMFGPRSAKVGAWLNLLNVLPLTYVLTLGTFFTLLFGGNIIVWMTLGAACVAAYSTLGGFRSVVYSDLVQFLVMCSSVVLVIVFSMQIFGGLGWLRAQPSVPETHWKLLGDGESFATALVWGVIALGTLVDPNFYQRCLAARDVPTARRGILWATLIWVCFDFCTTFGAMYALAVIPEAEPRVAYLVYSLQILPAGLRGFFLAGILATILSTFDSYLFLSGTIAAYDLAPKRLKGNIRFHHLGTVGMAATAVVMGILFERSELNLVDVWKIFGGFATACILLPLLAGHIFPKQVSDQVFTTACLSGVVLMLGVHGMQWIWPKHPVISGFVPFYFGLLGTAPVFLYLKPSGRGGGEN